MHLNALSCACQQRSTTTVFPQCRQAVLRTFLPQRISENSHRGKKSPRVRRKFPTFPLNNLKSISSTRRDMVSNQTLVKIASLGGFVIAGTGYAFHYRIQHDIKETETYKDVMSTLRAHKKVVPYLGEPIRLGRITHGDGTRTLEYEDAPVAQNYKWFKVPLTGANTKGKVYYEVTLNRELENKPEASKIEITFDNIPGKTFVIRQYEIS